MIELTCGNTLDYMHAAGRISANEPHEVHELPGGVSNAVLLVTLPDRGERLVLKQARGRLRVKEEWLCPIERIWREVEVLRICGELLQMPSTAFGVRSESTASVPHVLWEDRDNYCFAMSAAPEGHRTWKELLLAGETAASTGTSIACGRLLGTLHAASWNRANIASRLDDRSYFDQLRLDPYYRHVARVHCDLASHVNRLIESVWQHRRCLVHGDFSPKNLLVWAGHVMLIDFEVGHFGDPAFDLGFFLTHLVLKGVWAGPRRQEYLNLATTFWTNYQQCLAATVTQDELAELERRTLWNLAGCLLARVDGKSPVEYLSARQQSVVRRIARQWLLSPPLSLAAANASLDGDVLSTE